MLEVILHSGMGSASQPYSLDHDSGKEIDRAGYRFDGNRNGTLSRLRNDPQAWTFSVQPAKLSDLAPEAALEVAYEWAGQTQYRIRSGPFSGAYARSVLTSRVELETQAYAEESEDDSDLKNWLCHSGAVADVHVIKAQAMVSGCVEVVRKKGPVFENANIGDGEEPLVTTHGRCHRRWITRVDNWPEKPMRYWIMTCDHDARTGMLRVSLREDPN